MVFNCKYFFYWEENYISHLVCESFGIQIKLNEKQSISGRVLLSNRTEDPVLKDLNVSVPV